MKPAVSLITLGVKDLAASHAFYTETMGWKTDSKPEDGVLFFPLNNIVLGLFGRSALAEDAHVRDDGKGFPGFSLAHNLGSMEEVDALFADLKRKNAEIVKPPKKVFWGGYSGYFKDPDGFLWEVAWNPGWTVNADCTVTL